MKEQEDIYGTKQYWDKLKKEAEDSRPIEQEEKEDRNLADELTEAWEEIDKMKKQYTEDLSATDKRLEWQAEQLDELKRKMKTLQAEPEPKTVNVEVAELNAIIKHLSDTEIADMNVDNGEMIEMLKNLKKAR